MDLKCESTLLSPLSHTRAAVLRLFFDGYDASAPSVEWVFI